MPSAKQNLDIMKKSGLLNHLSEEEMSSLEEIKSPDPVFLLYHVPNFIYSFDSEYLSFGTYEERFTELLSTLFGHVDKSLNMTLVQAEKFDPTETITYQHILVKFLLNDTPYELILEYLGDWVMEITVFEVANRILKERGYEGQFIGIDSGDQVATSAYLTPEQQVQLEKTGLFKLKKY